MHGKRRGMRVQNLSGVPLVNPIIYPAKNTKYSWEKDCMGVRKRNSKRTEKCKKVLFEDKNSDNNSQWT